LLASARRWWQDTTLLCVTHDISETLEFDRVLVIDNGRIAEDGNPRRLASSPSLYRDLLRSEAHVLDRMWGASSWRRWRVANGRVNEDLAA
jgi:ATP-binding cassette subfamily B protein